MKQNIKIIPKTGAILIKDDKNILAISDLHLDDETNDVKQIVKDLKKLISKHKPDVLMIVGDIFNFGEGALCVNYFEKELSKLVRIEVVMGNHDLLIYPYFLVSDNYCFCHGDNDYGVKKELMIMGHTHPFFNNERVFLRGELKDKRRFIILPPFNKNLKGPDVKKDKMLLLGFVFEKDLIKKCEVINLKGEKISELIF